MGASPERYCGLCGCVIPARSCMSYTERLQAWTGHALKLPEKGPPPLQHCGASHAERRRAHLFQRLLDIGGGHVQAVVRRQLVGVAPKVLVAHAPALARMLLARVNVQAACNASEGEVIFIPMPWHY